MNEEYKIGDRVVVIDASELSDDVGIRVGLIGTICTKPTADYEEITYGVEFDDELQRGGSCYGRCRDNHGYYMYPREISLMAPFSDESIELDSEFDNILESILRTK